MTPSDSLERLLAYATDLSYDALPPFVKDAAHSVFVDTLGVMVGAHRQPIARKLNQYLALSSERGTATEICGFRKVSSATAAFANGAISHDLEVDDLHQSSSLHAAAVLVPAAIAIGEQTDASAEELLLALTRGYEIACRLAISMDPDRIYLAGFHPTTVCGAIGAAAVAASLLNLPASAFQQAVYLAMSLSSGIMACKTEPDHYTKSYQCGVAARNGVMAAQLVSDGFKLEGNRATIFEGFLRAYAGGTPRSDALTADFGQRYEIARTSYKLYPCCRHIYPLLDALAKIRQGATVDSANVEHVKLALYERGAINVADHTLRTHNARYVMAMALRHCVLRREFFMEDFGIDEVKPLMDRIELFPDQELQKEWPAKAPGIVTIHARDGGIFSEKVDCPRGSPDNPTALGELRDKFFSLVTPVIGQARCAELGDKLFSASFRLREFMPILMEREAQTA